MVLLLLSFPFYFTQVSIQGFDQSNLRPSSISSVSQHQQHRGKSFSSDVTIDSDDVILGDGDELSLETISSSRYSNHETEDVNQDDILQG